MAQDQTAAPSATMRLMGRVSAAIPPRGSLKRRTAFTAIWRLGGFGFSQMLRLAGNLVMARLLAPEAFGLMAIVIVVCNGLRMIADVGIRSAVMRSDRGGDPDFLRSAWTLQIVNLSVVAFGVVACAGALAVAQTRFDLGDSTYADPLLPALIAVSAASMFLLGFESMNVAAAERSLSVGRVVTIELISQLTGLATMLIYGLSVPSVWALVVAFVAAAAVKTVLSHVAMPGPAMGLRWDRSAVAEIWGIGKWLIGSSSLAVVERNGDRLILAALLTPEIYGLYAIARLWIEAAIMAIQHMNFSTNLAALSEIGRERTQELGKIFGKLRIVMVALGGAATAIFVTGGDLLVTTLYPENLAAVGAIIHMLAPAPLVLAFAPFGPLLLSRGDSKSLAKVGLVRAATLVLALPLAFWAFGVGGAFVVVAASPLAGSALIARRAAAHIPVVLWREYALIAALILLCSVLAIVFTPELAVRL
jgi:O-antigen/teichoic acid export membrane protein